MLSCYRREYYHRPQTDGVLLHNPDAQHGMLFTKPCVMQTTCMCANIRKEKWQVHLTACCRNQGRLWADSFDEGEERKCYVQM